MNISDDMQHFHLFYVRMFVANWHKACNKLQRAKAWRKTAKGLQDSVVFSFGKVKGNITIQHLA